jgi:undecaprenyl-diphosphatase
MDWLESLIMGVVQGVTEFLPISSDGHLTVCQMVFDRLRGRAHSGEANLFFDVMLHVGTMAAILVYYRREIREGMRGLLGATDVKPLFERPIVVRVGILAFIATLPLVPDALYFKKLIEQALTSPTVTGFGFLVTAAMLITTLVLRGGEKGPAETTWLDALLVGIAQAFAPLPGVSRSGLTITAALLLGFRRTWAVGFSLMLAVLAISGAAVFEIKDLEPALITADEAARTAAAMVVAGLVGYAAIAWLVRIVLAQRLWYFSVYLVVLALVVLTVFPAWGGRRDGGGRAQPVDRSARVRPARPGVAAPDDRGGQSLDRPREAGTRASARSVGTPARGRVSLTGLDVGGSLARRAVAPG